MVSEHTPHRSAGGWVFQGVVALLYVLLAVVDPGRTRETLALFVQFLGRVIPVLAIVLVLLFTFDLVRSPRCVRRLVGRQSGLMGWVTVLVGGMLSTGPVHAWYALLGELRSKGMKTSLATAFPYSRAVKLPLLPLLIHYFGLRYAPVFSAYIVGFAVAGGVLAEWIDPTDPNAPEDPAAEP